ncbi:prolyl oligopeptidase family serine peptidase [Streptomonospora wellingtoniae]|uniref:prolyl oligopeptidase n=1 Tax=Streptomonospora wellingtoniae TaxID=3075544 RepID=A0ABU2KXG5_9ACTN|nr:prolyl oligopeptidase family serine peptidase [Streptomonospora sp. DSM 45055]MDT0303862.1 prolyl oligopeptidase family serine peptidase [Streptomonospora sp. DSM 45055]
MSGGERAPLRVDTLHGTPVADPYRWLEEPDSPATRTWLAGREREFAAAAATWPLRAPLAERIRDLVCAELWTPPLRRGRRIFATRRRAGGEHPAVVAFEGAAGDGGPDGGARVRVVFDPHAFDPGGGTTLDSWEPSPDGEHVAVQTSSGGTERGALRVLSAATGLRVEDPIEGVRYSHVAWAGPEAFYYVRRDDGDGRRGVWLHRVATAGGGPDVLVRACGPRTVPGVRLLGGRWLVVSESHGTGHRNDIWIADLAPDDSGADGARFERPRWRTVHAGEEAETHPELGPDGLLYLRTTLGAERRRICAADPRSPGSADWREVVGEDPEATIDGFTATGTPESPELLVARTRLGISELTAHSAAHGGLLRRVDLPGEGMVTRLEPAGEGPGAGVHMCYADVATQQEVLVLDPGAERPRPWPRASRPRPPTPVRRRTLQCRSADGTRVPITLFTAEDPPDAGSGAPEPGEPGPTILHAYGGFGRPRQFGFSATVLAWLRAGGRYAVAHVRGGGDLGRQWHLRGARRGKPRAVDDLVAAADALAGQGVCTRGHLCLSGGSAGGLLVLAAAARRPNVCGAVIASAPLADMARFERLGLGPMWIREFGTAADPQDFAALMSYSPYHRVLADGAADRPAVLLTGFHGDTRTDAAHPRKMCAALLHHGQAERPALLRYEHDVGHGPRAVTKAIELAADAHAFAAAETGLAPPPAEEAPSGGGSPHRREGT